MLAPFAARHAIEVIRPRAQLKQYDARQRVAIHLCDQAHRIQTAPSVGVIRLLADDEAISLAGLGIHSVQQTIIGCAALAYRHPALIRQPDVVAPLLLHARQQKLIRQIDWAKAGVAKLHLRRRIAPAQLRQALA